MTEFNTDRVSRLEKHSALLRATWHPEKVLQLAQAAREIAGGDNVLYHGTRYTSAIIATMELRYADNIENICLTRSPEVAAYWAVLERDDDEKRGGILILDRELLHCRYRIEPFHDNWYDSILSPLMKWKKPF